MVAGYTCGDDFVRGMGRKYEVCKEETKVPCHDRQVDEWLGQFLC